MATRRSFLRSSFGTAVWLAAGAGGAWLLRDQVLWPTPDQSAVDGPESSGWLPFVARGRLVTVDVGLNGQRVTALLDSGAQYSAVDRAYAQTAGLSGGGLAPPLVAYGVGGQPQLGRSARVDLTLGALAVRGLRIASLALGPLAQAIGAPVPLILGQDVLQALVADIDFPRRRVSFHRSEAFRPPAGAETSTAAQRVGRAVHVDVTVEGRPLNVLVDTGSSAALALSTETATAAGLLDGRPVRRNRSVVLGGATEGGVVRAERLTFGDQVLRDVDVQLFQPVAVPGFPKGLLGVEALRRRRVMLDLSRGELHFAGPPN